MPKRPATKASLSALRTSCDASIQTFLGAVLVGRPNQAGIHRKVSVKVVVPRRYCCKLHINPLLDPSRSNYTEYHSPIAVLLDEVAVAGLGQPPAGADTIQHAPGHVVPSLMFQLGHDVYSGLSTGAC